jgi:hypothetical protein
VTPCTIVFQLIVYFLSQFLPCFGFQASWSRSTGNILIQNTAGLWQDSIL